LHKSDAEYDVHPIFNLKMPKSCPGVDSKILDPRNTWADKDAYEAQAQKLAQMFRDQFDKQGFGELGIEPVM
jgi:phosphoenolpyruvate carboxykinase (ATP)